METSVSDLNNLLTSLAPRTHLKDAETHCFDLAIELLKDSEHFKKVECHFESGSLITTYRCSLDNRTYTVKVTPERK
jgi:hypothetical protein